MHVNSTTILTVKQKIKYSTQRKRQVDAHRETILTTAYLCIEHGNDLSVGVGVSNEVAPLAAVFSCVALELARKHHVSTGRFGFVLHAHL